ncbi:MAG: NYN domain-containing protein [Acidobacteria bacterium]|nr:NYN domain-containing protein [Acidobacteriota bacterium]
MPWILDGNNLARGGNRERVRRAALALARTERIRIVLFFDGAPPAGSPDTERLGPVEVRYVPYADRAILDVVSPRGRGWRVASDDRALAVRVRAAGAECVAASSFWEKAASAEAKAPAEEHSIGTATLDGVERLVDAPARVPRRRRKKG